MIFKNPLRKKLLTICMILIGGSIIYLSFAKKITSRNFYLTTYDGAKDSLLPAVKVQLSNGADKYYFVTNELGHYYSWITPGRYLITLSKNGFMETTDSITVDFKMGIGVKMFATQKAIITKGANTDSLELGDSKYRKVIKTSIITDDGRNSTTFDAKTLSKVGGTRDVTSFKSRSTVYSDDEGIIGGARSRGDKIVMDDGAPRRSPAMVTGSATSMRSYKDGVKGEVSLSTASLPDIPNNPAAKAGLLTAGEVNDFSKWKMWNDIAEGDLKTHTDTWKMQPKNRYTVQVSNNDNFPIVNAIVKLNDKKGNTIWTATTDQTGKAELWAELYNVAQQHDMNYDMIITAQDRVEKVKSVKPFAQGINFVKLNAACSKDDIVDIAWVVDATGSMGDEISYLKEELNDVMMKAKSKHPDLNFRLGSVFYRDYGDAYLTQSSDLSSDISQTVNFIKNQSAGGGGDFPEAVDTALSVAINKLTWSKNARTKLLFLVLDAPPHTNLDNIERVKKVIEKAAQMGIHIIPVASSGIDKSTEYLMRCLALTTNGTYVFLTDDSGIGGSHIKPTTDEYKVETLNGLLLRLIDQYTLMVSCTKQLPDTFKYIKDTLQVQNRFNPKDTSKKDSTQYTKSPKHNDTATVEPHLKFANWKYYPNPTTGPLTVEIEGQINELFLTDFGGKILMRFQPGNERVFNINMEQYPSGVYFLRYYYNDKVLDGRVVLLH